MERTNGHAKTNPSAAELAEKLQVLSTLTTRLGLGRQMGFSHNGDRDLYKTLGYPDNIKSADLISRWKRQDVARAIVDRPVKATWRGAVKVQEPNQEEETKLELAYNQLEDDLHLKNAFMRVDRLAQLGSYAVILLGFDDSSKDTWSLPVTEGERSLKYVKVISESNAEISAWEKDASNERYGLPRLYNIKLKHPGEDEKTTSIRVHYSRVIHVVPDMLENEVEGEPIMKTAFNRLMDIEKLVGGSAEMFWRGARPGYAGKADPDYKVDSDLEKKMQEQIQEYENDLRRIMVMEGVDLESLAQQVADPKGHIEVQIMMLSALTGIPVRILMGSERGELASTQDDGNWKEWLHDRRTEIAEPTIIRPFVRRMMQVGVLPEPLDEMMGFEISWPDLFTLDEKDKAEVGSKQASAISSYAREPMATNMVPLEGFLRYILRLDDAEVTHILEMQERQLDELMEEENELGRISRTTEPAEEVAEEDSSSDDS